MNQTESLAQLNTQCAGMRTEGLNLEAQVLELRRKVEDACRIIKVKDSTISDNGKETERLKAEIGAMSLASLDTLPKQVDSDEVSRYRAASKACVDKANAVAEKTNSLCKALSRILLHHIGCYNFGGKSIMRRGQKRAMSLALLRRTKVASLAPLVSQ